MTLKTHKIEIYSKTLSTKQECKIHRKKCLHTYYTYTSTCKENAYCIKEQYFLPVISKGAQLSI